MSAVILKIAGTVAIVQTKAGSSEKQVSATSYLARVASRECIRYFARDAICIYSYMQIDAGWTG